MFIIILHTHSYAVAADEDQMKCGRVRFKADVKQNQPVFPFYPPCVGHIEFTERQCVTDCHTNWKMNRMGGRFTFSYFHILFRFRIIIFWFFLRKEEFLYSVFHKEFWYYMSLAHKSARCNSFEIFPTRCVLNFLSFLIYHSTGLLMPFRVLKCPVDGRDQKALPFQTLSQRLAIHSHRLHLIPEKRFSLTWCTHPLQL